jgi:hypothetical protein
MGTQTALRPHPLDRLRTSRRPGVAPGIILVLESCPGWPEFGTRFP